MRGSAGTATLDGVSIADEYVVALDGALLGPARLRRDLVREARDHLEDATAALDGAGYDRDEAERIAVADFGPLDEIVPAFQTTLAVASARRTAWMLLGVLSVQPLLWDGPLGPHDQHPDPNGVVFSVLDHVVEYGGALMILAALGLLVACGVGNRWFAAGRRTARLTSVVAIGTAVSVKVIGISMVLLSASADPSAWLLLALFIVVPLSLTASQARRTLTLC